jgi:aspartyl-tRNA(Asn)/glutamyl-tRNA(Gln) amidotransferase subunit A
MTNACWNRRKFIASSAAATTLFAKPSWSQSADPTDFTIAEAGQQIRTGELSPVELSQAYLERIERVDGQLNSFITVTGDRAMARARELERELSLGQWRGPLHGIPIALKDNIDTVGIRTTAASAIFADRIPNEDAEVVTRLEQAGAILLGKLNMHEFAYGASSAISHFGPVRNPWDLTRITGGSSGGPGAAVSARLCAGALGTDTGGSIRIPAAHCGIVGLKPTYGLASVRGIIPLSVTLDHVGPMCRTVADSALMLQAIAGYDAGDNSSIQTEVPSYAGALYRPTSQMRLGIPRSYFYDDVDPQISESIEQALIVLAELTASVSEIELPPRPGGTPVLVDGYGFHKEYLADNREQYGKITLDRITRGAGISAIDYAKTLSELMQSRAAIGQVFESVDLLITPTLTRLPAAIDEAMISSVDDILIRNPSPFNIYGIPTISIPCGFSRQGWPIGLQISGPALGEVDVLSLAHAYEQATDWHERVPPLI